MRHQFARLGMVSAFVVTVAACGGAAGDASSPTAAGPPASQSAPSESESPEPTPPNSVYVLANGTRVDVGEIPATLTAVSGQVSLQATAGDSVTWTVSAMDKKGQVTWNLSLTLSPQNRVEAGSLVAQGRTWTALPNTGEIHIERVGSTISLQTVHAITMSGVETPNVNTPMVATLVGQGTAGS